MLHGFFSSFLVFVFSLVLASCAGVDDKAQDFQLPVGITGMQKFSAWKQDKSLAGSTVVNKAVQVLLQQADVLIANNQREQASDKLERLLRIESSYAQAWSRLAWIALQDNRPRRSQQMAQRSNSFAYKDKILKTLNWSFIRQAGQQTGDEAVIRKAEKMIEALNGSMDSL